MKKIKLLLALVVASATANAQLTFEPLPLTPRQQQIVDRTPALQYRAPLIIHSSNVVDAIYVIKNKPTRVRVQIVHTQQGQLVKAYKRLDELTWTLLDGTARKLTLHDKESRYFEYKVPIPTGSLYF